MIPADNNSRRGRYSRYALLLGVLLAVAAATLVFLRRQPRGPKVLNQPTRAREQRPLTTQPDDRFAPLPLEREKHGR